MISADVIGRRPRPGDAGPDVWLSVRTIIGCATIAADDDDSRLALSPSAFLTRLPPPPLGPATGDDTSAAPAVFPPEEAAGHEEDLVGGLAELDGAERVDASERAADVGGGGEVELGGVGRGRRGGGHREGARTLVAPISPPFRAAVATTERARAQRATSRRQETRGDHDRSGPKRGAQMELNYFGAGLAAQPLNSSSCFIRLAYAPLVVLSLIKVKLIQV